MYEHATDFPGKSGIEVQIFSGHDGEIVMPGAQTAGYRTTINVYVRAGGIRRDLGGREKHSRCDFVWLSV